MDQTCNDDSFGANLLHFLYINIVFGETDGSLIAVSIIWKQELDIEYKSRPRGYAVRPSNSYAGI